MFRRNQLFRVAALGAIIALAACDSDKDVLGPSTPPGGALFKSYVALGNSITAGFQSNGINDSTQRESYARLLATQMGTQYHYASLATPGCPPPIANGLTGALVGAQPAGPCRTASSVTDVLNNVAVPGARVLDPTSSSTVASNPLTTFILGGKTQVQKALDARPTFATIWIGNNDVLQPALSGLFLPIVSTPAQFQTAYDQMITELLAGAPDLKGVLIGVAKAQYLPTMVAAPTINSAVMTQLTGKPVTVDAGCATSPSLVNVVSLVQAIKGGTHPALVACSKGVFPAPVGDVYILDTAEQATLDATIDAYNTYIENKATAIDFGYWDPNTLFQASRESGAIPPFPNFTSTKETYGKLISLDAVHPTGAAHKLIANALIEVIHEKYGTTLAPVQ